MAKNQTDLFQSFSPQLWGTIPALPPAERESPGLSLGQDLSPPSGGTVCAGTAPP